MISAIIFDCDGVLVDSEILMQEIETKTLRDVGLHYDSGEFNSRFMGLSADAFWNTLEKDALERIGRPIKDELSMTMEKLVSEAISTRLVEVPGALDAIASIKHPKAVASSSSLDSLKIKLKRVGHWSYFAPHIYSAEHVINAKPAPDLFLHAAKMLGVAPKECLVIEDSVNGVKAGCAAGMRVWGFVGGGHNDEHSADRLAAAGAEYIIKNWQEAAKLFAAL